MNCQDYREILSARLDGEATKGESSRVDPHLRGCADCRRYLEACIALRERLQDWQDEISARVLPPGPVPARGYRWFLRVPRLAAAAAMLLVTLGAGFLAGRASAPEPVEIVGESPRGFFVATKTVYPERNEVYSVAVLTPATPPRGN